MKPHNELGPTVKLGSTLFTIQLEGVKHPRYHGCDSDDDNKTKEEDPFDKGIEQPQLQSSSRNKNVMDDPIGTTMTSFNNHLTKDTIRSDCLS